MSDFQNSLYDTSDLILKTFNDLKDYMSAETKNQIAMHYLNHQYENVINLLEQSNMQDDKEIIPDFRRDFRLAKENDKPQTNYSRRYFETILSSGEPQGTVMSEGESSSFIKFAKFLNKVSPELYQREASNEDIAIAKGTKQSNSLTIEKIDKIADKVREYEDEVPRISALRDSIREKKDSLYNNKDRSKEKRDLKSKPLSQNRGIMTANQVSYRDQLLDKIKIGKPVDTHSISLTKDHRSGFSAENKNVPFVNSLSGTTYGLVALLSEYMEQNKNDPKLQEDVNNIIKYNVSFRIKNGFHSYEEMHAVLNDKGVKEIFQKYGVKVSNIFEAGPVLDTIENAYEYSQALVKKRAINKEVLKLNVQDLQLASPKDYSPLPTSPRSVAREI